MWLWQAISEIEAQLVVIADFDDQVKSLRIRYEFTTKANKEVGTCASHSMGVLALPCMERSQTPGCWRANMTYKSRMSAVDNIYHGKSDMGMM